jgi:hypothetical protein
LFLTTINSWLENHKTGKNDSTKKIVESLKENLKHQESIVENFNNQEKLITIPIKEQFKTSNITTKKTYKKLVIILDKTGEIKGGNIIELIPKEHDFSNISNSLIKAVFTKASHDFTGIFSILSISNNFIYELEFSKGNLVTTKYRRSKAKNSNITAYNSGETISSCIDWYLVTTYYYSDGSSSQTWDYLYRSCGSDAQECTIAMRIDDTDTPFIISCGGGNDGSSIVYSDIIKLLTSPCFIQLVNSISDEKLKSEIFQLYQEVFVGYGNTFNVKFEESPNLRDPLTNDPVEALSGRDSNEPNTWVVALNSSIATQVPKEIWTQIILHEIIHGFLRINSTALNFGPSIGFSEAHEAILGGWIDQMTDALIELHNIPEYDAKALAIQGINDVLMDETNETFRAGMLNWVNQTYNIDLIQADAVVDQYLSGQKGTRCQ